MRIPISTDLPDLEHVETTPQSQLDAEFMSFLSERVARQRSVMREAMLWCSLGEPTRAYYTLSQGVNE